MKNQKRKQDRQVDNFISAAVALECDESEERFDETLKNVARHKQAIFHWSDCAVNNGPALPSGPCNCGGLNLTSDMIESARVAFIPVTGRFGFFVDHMGGEGFVEEHVFPTDALIRIASASNLINAHSGLPRSKSPDGVDLDNSRPAIIAKLKAFARSKSFTSN